MRENEKGGWWIGVRIGLKGEVVEVNDPLRVLEVAVEVSGPLRALGVAVNVPGRPARCRPGSHPRGRQGEG